MANTIVNVKNGKYLRKTGDNTYDKIHLETNDSQVVLASDVVISGVTYDAGTPLSGLLANINSTGGKYRLREHSYLVDGAQQYGVGTPIYLEESVDGGTTWTKKSTLTVSLATQALTANSAADANFAEKIGTSDAALSNLCQKGSATQPVYIAADGTVTAATAYGSASVLNATNATNVALTSTGTGSATITVKAGTGSATFTVNGVEKATKDASGNVITATYATKAEVEDIKVGKSSGYVTSSSDLSGSAFSGLVQNKTASQQTLTLTVDKDATLPLYSGEPVEAQNLKSGDTVYLTDSDKTDWFVANIMMPPSQPTKAVIDFYTIEADSPALTGFVTGTGLTANKIVLGNGSSTVKASTCEISTNVLVASATGSDSYVMTEKATKSTIDTAISSHSGVDKVGTVTGVELSGGSTRLATTSNGLVISPSLTNNATGEVTLKIAHAVPSGASEGILGSTTARYYIKTISTDAYGHVTGVSVGNETVTNSNTWRSIKVDGSEKLASGTGTGAVDFVDGTGIDAVWTASGSKISFNLKTSGVTAGTYSAVEVDTYGRVTSGAQMIMWGNESSFSTDNYDALAENGILITLGA